MRLAVRSALLAALVCSWLAATAVGQATGPSEAGTASDPPDSVASPPVLVPPVAKRNRSLERSFVPNLLRDQRAFWTSPKTVDLSAMQKLVLFGGLATAIYQTDQATMNHHFRSPTLVQRSGTLTNAGVLAIGAAPAALYLWGRHTQDEHKRETGVLAFEALANSFLVTQGIKFAAGRHRPDEGDGSGSFRQGGSSFPSEHSAAAWSIATVIANEYPGPLTKLLAYGTASGISLSRVTGRKHFPSDVLVGGALGWYLGRSVYQSHHNGELGGASIGTFSRNSEERPWISTPASTYVPLDSWLYPAMDRLVALGFVDSAMLGLRPWTRLESARLLREAQDRLGENAPNEALHLIQSLDAEFSQEKDVLDGGANVGARLDSLYMRWSGISGMPLRDGYHFAQTLVNDFGRPYAEGANYIVGFTSYAEAGPLAFYLRAEYQHAPSLPALPLSAREDVQQVDQLPPGYLPPSSASPSVDRLQLLEAYAAMSLHNWQLSYGRQSLWWGPERSGPMLLSNNAQPINMFRISRTSPFRLPGIFKLMGPVRTEFFLGQFSGYEFVLSPLGFNGQFGQALAQQPFIHGQKISFKPTPNLEFGFSRTTIFGGPGYPFTFHSFANSLFTTGNAQAGSANKPGKRASGFDLSYRVPGLRNWMTFYADGLAYDQFSPVAYWDRSAWTAGLYMPRLPKLPKLDLRVEGIYTDLPIGGAVGDGFYYFNLTWRSGYTNNGNLLGSWIGRQGQGAQAWATYHLSPRNFIETNFRHQKVSGEFIPGGGSLTDVGARAAYQVRPDLNVSGGVQWERWLFPVIASTEQENVTASFQITFQPRHWGKHQTSTASK